MRVISGSARGLKIKSVDGLATRPTADRIKETLFNMLAPDLLDCRFLDLFSGTGAIGIEALSRGARQAVFVDNSPAAVSTIRFNLNTAKFTKYARVLHMDFLSALDLFVAEDSKFDIIFLDPPYNMNLATQAVDKIALNQILNEGGHIVVELENKGKIQSDAFEVCRYRDYRACSIVFLQKVKV